MSTRDPSAVVDPAGDPGRPTSALLDDGAGVTMSRSTEWRDRQPSALTARRLLVQLIAVARALAMWRGHRLGDLIDDDSGSIYANDVGAALECLKCGMWVAISLGTDESSPMSGAAVTRRCGEPSKAGRVAEPIEPLRSNFTAYPIGALTPSRRREIGAKEVVSKW